MPSALYLMGNLFVDVLYGYLNPRIRRQAAAELTGQAAGR